MKIRWGSDLQNASHIALSLTLNALWNAAAAKPLQSCLTLCDPTDGSPPGSPVPGILQARTLEWVAIPVTIWELWASSKRGSNDTIWAFLNSLEQKFFIYFSSVQLLSRVRLFETSCTTALQASRSITNSWNLLRFMSIESVMPSNHLIHSHIHAWLLEKTQSWLDRSLLTK